MKKFILIICLSLMGFSIASQISFNSGMLSEILKFRIDFDKRSMALEDSENMLVQPEGPIFRRTGTEFIDEAITEISYTTTEANEPNTPVYGDYTKYMVLWTEVSNYSYKPIAMVNVPATIDTSWVSSGYWQYTGYGAGEGIASRTFLQLSDGNLLLAHTYYHATKINIADGTTDTTFATNGTFSDTAPNANEFTCMLEDNDGNIYLFTSVYGKMYKLDSNGTQIDYASGLFANPQRALWFDTDKTKIIIFSNSWFNGTASSFVNICVINASDLTLDSTWTGNVGLSGYAYTGNTDALYNAVRSSDGNFIIHRNSSSYKNLCKWLADGTDYDTTWGTNGEIDFGTSAFGYGDVDTLAQDSDGYVYFISRPNIDGSFHAVVNKIDSTGSIVDTNDIGVSGQYVYHTLGLVNDSLFLGTSNGAGTNNQVEIWTKDLDYVEGFDVADPAESTIIFGVWAEETTREVTYTGGGTGETITTTITTSDKTRLIPFTYSNTDNYVLEFGHNFVGFLR
jgi:hypothetical protein